jgi:hypothetical protein
VSAPLSPFKVHVADQVLAALAEAAPMPLSTPALQDRTGYGPRHGQLVYPAAHPARGLGRGGEDHHPGRQARLLAAAGPAGRPAAADRPQRPRQETPVMTDFDTTVRALRRWTANHDLHVRAAVELLIEHETWIRRADFARACTRDDRHKDGTMWIDWRKAREFVSAGSVASTSEMAVLDLAVALGENRYRFSIMGAAHSRMIAQAVARALGEDR